jgi:peptidoglycan/xylan/chitin deacetylase (PgdA/CDA1 family)
MKKGNALRIAALFVIAAFAVLASTPARVDALDLSKEVHVAVLLTTDAHLVLDGKPATLQEVERAIDDIASKGGVFWYARENDGTFKTIVDG